MSHDGPPHVPGPHRPGGPPAAPRPLPDPQDQGRPQDQAPQTDQGRPPERRVAPVTVPYGIVLAGVLGGLLWVWLSQTHVKGGMLVIASALLFAGGARLVLSDERAGLLASRRRGIDVAAFAILGAGLLVSALLLKSPS